MEGLDETIEPLVNAMNLVPFVTTFSSCGGHPEESSVREYGYAVADIIFEVEDESENLIQWFEFVQGVLRQRKMMRPKHEYGVGFAKQYSLNSDGFLGWNWALKIQAAGKTPVECRAGLDEGIEFLIVCFNEVAA